MGLWLFLLQVPSISVFFMNEYTSKAFEIGAEFFASGEKLVLQPATQKAPLEIQKSPENSTHPKPKKKKSK